MFDIVWGMLIFVPFGCVAERKNTNSFLRGSAVWHKLWFFIAFIVNLCYNNRQITGMSLIINICSEKMRYYL